MLRFNYCCLAGGPPMWVLGLMVSTFKAVPFSQFHTSSFQVRSWRKVLKVSGLSDSAEPENWVSLVWWLHSLGFQQGTSFLPLTVVT